MNPMFRSSAVVFAIASVAACGGADEPTEQAPEAAVVAAPTGAVQPMEGMEGMHGGMQGMGGQSGMALQMQAHMQRMDGVRGDSLTQMIPEHRQMAANMIAQMNREMRDMNMTADAEWNATVDSLREDLVRLPEMTADELATFLPEHRARIDRLIKMHQGMMGM